MAKEPEGHTLRLLLFPQQTRQCLRRFRQGQHTGGDAQLRTQTNLAPQGVGVVEQDEMRHALLLIGEIPGAQLRREKDGALRPQVLLDAAFATERLAADVAEAGRPTLSVCRVGQWHEGEDGNLVEPLPTDGEGA